MAIYGIVVEEPGNGNQVFTLDELTGHVSTLYFLATVGNPRVNWTAPSISGTDFAGTVTATTGATAPAAGAVADVTFRNPYSSPPKCVDVGGQLGAYASNVTANGFTINSIAAPAINTAYNFNYLVIG